MRTRGFEVCTGYEDKAVLPRRADGGSCGYDFYIIKNDDTTIYPQETIKFMTGIKAYMPKDEVFIMNIRSSMGIKKNLILSNCQGWIDSSFYDNEDNEGNICIAITNIGNMPQVIPANSKVAQGTFIKYLIADNDVTANDKRIGGIGSSGEY
jgi:dUTP pyrophosphatase